MNVKPRVNLVLCWHMHQPWYQLGIDGDYKLPWVYLHAIKDYEDMVMHLEAHPDMRVVVNFAPVLLEQLDDYVQQLKGWLDHGKTMKDPMLNLLAGAQPIPGSTAERYKLLCDCQRANAEKMINPYPVYKGLLKTFNSMVSEELMNGEEMHSLSYLKDQYFIDVLVWYHIAWLGHSLKQTKVSGDLIAKAGEFNKADRRSLVQLIYDCISGLIARYRKLAEKGQIELSMSPYGHPIIPLLNDLDNMVCAQPEEPGPDSDRYPEGAERSRWHLQHGIEVFERYFGFRPKGIWLSEGAISEDAVALIEEYGFEWTASGEGVWRNSMKKNGVPVAEDKNKLELFHPYLVNEHTPELFFRDDGLSDLIGFDYSKYHSEEAAKNLVEHLVNIADLFGPDADRRVISIILDGENAWEYYPHNGYYFLDHLYDELSHHEQIRPTTYSELHGKTQTAPIKKLCAGSWVYGSFSTWIGQKDKNKAWDRLIEAKQAYDSVIMSGKLGQGEIEKATRQLAICEGSDWFWWFGDSHASSSVSDFDELFREQLKNLYRLLKLPEPEILEHSLSVGGEGTENAGTMVRNVG